MIVIQTIADLIEMTEREADSTEKQGFPTIAEQTRLRSPGCSIEEIARLREALPGLTESYLNVAAQVYLPNVSIGYLSLAPGGLRDGNLFNRLTKFNSPASPQWDYVDDHNLYEVAHYPGSLVCVAREGTVRPGEVVRVDYEWGGVDDLVLHRTTWSFEQLLLGFGRIREQRLAKRRGPEVIDEVLRSLRKDFGFDDEQMEDWTWFASEALGEI
jgi:hypothetical protein